MSETRIRLDLAERSHDIVVARGAIDRAGDHLAPFARDGRIVVVTDENVMVAQGQRLIAGLRRDGLRTDVIAIRPGEGSKSWAGLSALVDAFAARGVARGDTILAFGGGVVGDLAGFAAAIFKRGCGIVQVPTSLLAMVDSAIGGKTGINLAAGKNLAGSFHQPLSILIDPLCLTTLHARYHRSGLAEMVKYGLIDDAEFFAWYEANTDKLTANDAATVERAIIACARAKARVVVADSYERSGQRALLNLGHSFAHALEAESGFGDALLHGEAVAIGLAVAFRLSVARGLCPPEDAIRVEACLRRLGLPTRPREAGITIAGRTLAGRLSADKKATGDGATLILVRGIGRAFIAPDLPLGPLADQLEQLLDA